MATQSDDLARLTQLVTRALAVHGLAEQVRMANGVTLSELGKASGATAEQAGLWLTGRATASKDQALAVFGMVYERASWREAAGNGETETPASVAGVSETVPARPRRVRR